MSRKPHQPAELGDTAGPMPEGHAITIAGEQETADIERDMAFEAARMLGQIEALEFTRNISDLSQVQIFLNLKQNKAYRALTYRDADGNTKRISHLEEFCERYLKKSHRRMQQLAANYHLLGAELYETAERIGFRTQDYAALKALPADDQAVIKQAIETDDRETILSLMQELAAKHQSEKAALETKAKEAEATASDRDQVIAKKETKINELELKVAAAERRQATFTDEERRNYECAPLHDTINDAMIALAQMATQIKHLVENVGGELVTEECFHAVLLPIKRALEIANHNRLHIDLQTLFDDQYDGALDGLQMRAAGLNPEAMQ